MAKRKRIGKAIIDNFRGLHELPPADDKTFTREIGGVIDSPAGDLMRMAGKMSYGSNPMGSIWGIAQLRFKGNWGIVVQATSSRIWYDHNPYKGPEDGLIQTPHADISITIIPGYIVPGETEPDYGKPDVGQCHSDIIVHYGIYEYPVDDLKICQRTRGTVSWSGVAGWNANLSAAYDAGWNNVKAWPAYWNWSGWTRYTPPHASLVAPFFRVRVEVGYPGGVLSYNVKFHFLEVEQKPCSDTLADPPNTPWGGTYQHARWRGGGIFFDDLSDYIGNALAACTGTTCADQVIPAAQGGIDPDAAAAASKSLLNTFTETDTGTYNDVLGSQSPTWDDDATELILWSEGGWFEHVNSCFEE